MTPDEFKEIRDGLQNPSTGKAATQTELAALLKSMCNTGSRQLIAKIEAGDTPIRNYISDSMEGLSLFGWPVDRDEYTNKNKLKVNCIDTIRSIQLTLDNPNDPEYIEDLKVFANQASGLLARVVNELLQSN